MYVPVSGPASLHLPELPALSWWHRGPDGENFCQRCLCSSDSICPAYHFPSALPQLMAVCGVLSRHFPHPANGAKVSGPHVIIAVAAGLRRARHTGVRDLFVNMRDTLIVEIHGPGKSYGHAKHKRLRAVELPWAASNWSAVIWVTSIFTFISTAVVWDVSVRSNVIESRTEPSSF